MSDTPPCSARRQNDEMHCDRCKLRWTFGEVIPEGCQAAAKLVADYRKKFPHISETYKKALAEVSLDPDAMFKGIGNALGLPYEAVAAGYRAITPPAPQTPLMRYLTETECQAFGERGSQDEVRPILVTASGEVVKFQCFTRHAGGWREPHEVEYGSARYARFIVASDFRAKLVKPRT